jgi:hypothetical protein
MNFTIFLDIDGVLNSKTTVERTPKGYTGIDDARVSILAEAIKKYGGAEIILSSDWKELNKNDKDYGYLLSKLGKFDLVLAGRTTDHWNHRGEGIMNYLDEHPEIDEFVILDDNKFDFQNYRRLWERFLVTNGIERAEFASKTPAVEAIIFLDYIKSFL